MAHFGHLKLSDLLDIMSWFILGHLKLPDLLDIMSWFILGHLKLPDLLDMMSRIIMERNYDAQIEDAFRLVNN